MAARRGATTRTWTWSVEDGTASRTEDILAGEEPLEIRIKSRIATHPVAVTMRTPGADFELVAGFLFTEGVISAKEQIRRLSYCVDDDGAEQHYNVVSVELASGVAVDVSRLERHFSISSACGVCGKASLEALRLHGLRSPGPGPQLTPSVLTRLGPGLREGQKVFSATGGLHASGLFTADGRLVAVREDVGRHNAMDKLIGWALLEGRVPLSENLVMLSGRSSFELVQKALAAGVPAVCSVSAPSSLAVDLAREFGITLVGFLRDGRFKVYSGIERVTLLPETDDTPGCAGGESRREDGG